MKNLLLVVLVVLFSCAEEQKIAPVYPSLEGWWKFNHKEASGVFEIVDYDGVLMVDNGPGNAFSISGSQYLVKEKNKLIGTVKREIFLVNSNDAIISFYAAEYDKDFTKLTAEYWTINHNGVLKAIMEPITITR